MLPESVKKFASVFAKLPSIGPRQALRLAFYLVESGASNLTDIEHAVKRLQSLRLCENCFFTHENKDGLCDICKDPRRNQSFIAIVEKATDLISLEKTKKFGGRYLVLGDLKKTGVMEPEQKLRLGALKKFIEKNCGGKAEEIIIALSPTAYGDLNAAMLGTEIKAHAKKISRLGRGIPTGGEIEFADEETLSSALEKRG